MIAARTLKSKEAIDELVDSGENMEDIEIAASNAEKALNSIGLTARTQTGDFKDLEVILGEVAAKWDSLNNSTKQYVSEQLAGNNRRSFFIGLMENYDRTMELQKLAEDSSGQLMEASEKKANSLEGQLNKLQNAWANLYQSMLNSDFTKGAVSGLADLVNGISKVTKVIKPVLIPALGAATGAMVAFNIATQGFSGSIAGQFIDKIYTMGTSLKALAVSLGTTKLAMIGLAGIIGGVALAAISHFIQKGQEKKEMLEGMTQAIDDYNEASERTTEVDVALDEYEKLHQELRDMNTTEERRQEIEQQIADIREVLSTDERYKEILEQENALIQDQLDNIREINEIDRKNNAIEAYDKTDLNDKDITKIQDRITNRQSYIERLNSDIESFNQSIADAEQRLQNAGKNSREWKRAQEDIAYYTSLITDSEIERAKAEEEITEKIEQIVAYQEAGVALGKEGFTNDRDAMDIIEKLAPLYETLTGEKLDLVKLSGEELTNEQQITEEKQKQSEISGDSGDNSEDEKEALVARQKELNEKYVEALNSLQEIADLTERIQDGLSLDDMNTILNSDLMDGFTGSIDNAVDITEHLKNKMQEVQDVVYKMYGSMQLADQEYWDSMIRESAKALGVNEDEFVKYINSKGLARNVDVKNATSASNAELQMNIDLINQLLTGYAGITNQKAGYRKVDMANVVNFLNEQGKKEGMTVNQLNGIWANFYNAKKKAIKSELKDLNKQAKAMKGFAGDPTVRINMNKLQRDLASLEAANGLVNNYFSGVNTTFKNISTGFAQAATTASKAITNAYRPSSTTSTKRPSSSRPSSSRPSSSRPSSSSSYNSNNREVDDLDLNINKFTQLEEAINRAEEALQRNYEAQEAVTKKADLAKLLDQEIQLMEKKKNALEQLKQAQIKEQQSLKSYLQRAGLRFNGDELVGDNVTGGSVSDRLKDAQNWANKASGAEKERRIADTKYLKEQIDAYYDLMNAIGSTQGQINDLTLEMHKNKIENEVLMRTVKDLGDRYIKVTMKMGKLDAELSLNQRKQELATGQVLLNLRERELRILQEKKKVNQQNIDELKKEQKELRDVIASAGFGFNPDGSISNYDAIWTGKMNEYNSLAGYKKEEYEGYMTDLAGFIERYVEILNTELPKAEENFYDILEAEKQLAKQQEEYNKQLEELANNYDRLFEIRQKLNKAENELALIEAKMEHASYEEKITYLERQEEIYKSQLKLLEQQKNINKDINRERKEDLIKIGFKFDEDGLIKNYDEIVGAMHNKIQNSVGGAVRDELIEDYNDLIAKVEEYNETLNNVNTSEQDWWDINNAIKDSQQSQLDLVKEIQDSIGNAITNRWQETTDTIKKELQKQQDLLSKEWEDEDWSDQLADAQDELNKIQAQINNLSKDTSLAGQMKLEQLKEQYAEQLKAMNDMIKQHERDLINQSFNDEITKIDEQMEEALKTEELMKSVNEALSTGFVTIGEQAIKLNDLLVDQLKEAKELWGDITSLGQAITNKTPSARELKANRASTVNTNAPLVNVSITGDLDSRITLDDINRITKQATDDAMVKLYELLK